MSTKISHDTKFDGLILYAQGHKRAAIAKSLGISISMLQRAQRKLCIYGDIEGGVQKRGPEGKLDFGMLHVFSLYLWL